MKVPSYQELCEYLTMINNEIVSVSKELHLFVTSLPLNEQLAATDLVVHWNEMCTRAVNMVSKWPDYPDSQKKHDV